MTCHCDGLGFDVDWGGIVGNVVKTYGAVQQTRHALALQQAQAAAALRAQQAEDQLMLRRYAQTVAHPVAAGQYVMTPGQQVRITAPPPRETYPPWLLPAVGVGVGLLFLMRK